MVVGDELASVFSEEIAAGYGDDEYMLLGMAIKYAGLRGVNLQIIGVNHATF